MMLVMAVSVCIKLIVLYYSWIKPVISVLLTVTIAVTCIIAGVATDNGVGVSRNDWGRGEVKTSVETRIGIISNVRVNSGDIRPADVLNLLRSHLATSSTVPQDQVVVLFKPGCVIGVPASYQ